MLKTSIYIAFLFIFFSTGLRAQSIIGIFGGWNSSAFFHKEDSNPHYAADYDSEDIFILGLSIKERKDRLFNIGLVLDYTSNGIK